jgi:hypothetical protein
MQLVAYVFEGTYLARELLLSSPSKLKHVLGHLVPRLKGDLVNLQTSIFSLTMTHLIFDDSRARLPPNQGGLGYNAQLTTLQGMVRLWEEHVKAGGHGEARSKASGGVTFSFLKHWRPKARSKYNATEKTVFTKSTLPQAVEIDAHVRI